MSSLEELRKVMKEQGVGGYLVYSEDAHQSEYVPDVDKRRGFISQFTGSAGQAVITESKAALWTDGRYYLQASLELNSKEWILMKAGLPETPSIADWLCSVLPANSAVAVDPKLIAKSQATALDTALQAKGHKLVSVFDNLVDKVWTNKPAAPQNPIMVHPVTYAGVSHSDKLALVRNEMKKENVGALVVVPLDEIAWLFNIRGSDVSFNPVVISYALITMTEATLYVDQKKVTPEVQKHLGSEVTIKDYNAIFADLKKCDQKIWVDPLKANLAIYDSITSQIFEKFSPIVWLKAIKNDVELQGFRECHKRDAAALVSFLAWLEEELVVHGKKDYDEYTLALKLDSFRAEQPLFVSLSFETISGFGPNGAIIHYKPEEGKSAKVDTSNMYLVDSGGQYRDGTTDVTRTVHFGTPTAWQKRCFTRVLQSHIALDSTVFPKGTVGNTLDVLARTPLWADGLDYRHGTGHGVGSFLNVHEGPQGISFRPSAYNAALEVGMTVTNEPGYYEDGAFGIRIENVLVVQPAQTVANFGGKGYLGFEHITYVPIQTKLVDVSLMSAKDIQWLNHYNKECFDKISPLLQGKALDYLKRETAPL